eukprot:g6801.t1
MPPSFPDHPEALTFADTVKLTKPFLMRPSDIVLDEKVYQLRHWLFSVQQNNAVTVMPGVIPPGATTATATTSNSGAAAGADSVPSKPPAANVLVCLHGIGGSKYDFAGLIKHYANDMRGGSAGNSLDYIAALDFPFCGGNCNSEWDVRMDGERSRHFLLRENAHVASDGVAGSAAGQSPNGGLRNGVDTAQLPPHEEDIGKLARFVHQALEDRILPPIRKTRSLNWKMQMNRSGQASSMKRAADHAEGPHADDGAKIRVHLLGHSFAGVIAMHYATLFGPSSGTKTSGAGPPTGAPPSYDLTSVTIVDTPLIYPRNASIVNWVLDASPSEEHYVGEFDGVRNAEFRDFLARGNMPGYTYWDTVLQTCTASVGFHRYCKIVRADMASANTEKMYEKTVGGFEEPGAADGDAAATNARVVFFVAEQNLRLMQQSVDFLQANGFPCVKVQNAGHFLMIDEPRKFSALLKQRLTGLC